MEVVAPAGVADVGSVEPGQWAAGGFGSWDAEGGSVVLDAGGEYGGGGAGVVQVVEVDGGLEHMGGVGATSGGVGEGRARLVREGLGAAGFELLPGDHPIIPVMLHDARRAAALAEALLARGVYVIAFSYPVVPKGKARIRTQISATHTRDELERAVAAFAEAAKDIS